MTHEEMMALKIENIEEYRTKVGSIGIRFQIQKVWFKIYVHDNPDKTFSSTGNVFHFKDQDEACPFCQNTSTTNRCPVLYEHRTALFQRLIHSNSLRLIWLYREYKISTI